METQDVTLYITVKIKGTGISPEDWALVMEREITSAFSTSDEIGIDYEATPHRPYQPVA